LLQDEVIEDNASGKHRNVEPARREHRRAAGLTARGFPRTILRKVENARPE